MRPALYVVPRGIEVVEIWDEPAPPAPERLVVTWWRGFLAGLVG